MYSGRRSSIRWVFRRRVLPACGLSSCSLDTVSPKARVPQLRTPGVPPAVSCLKGRRLPTATQLLSSVLEQPATSPSAPGAAAQPEFVSATVEACVNPVLSSARARPAVPVSLLSEMGSVHHVVLAPCPGAQVTVHGTDFQTPVCPSTICPLRGPRRPGHCGFTAHLGAERPPSSDL